MLQQTTVATVKERFDIFIERWPSIEALAAAPLDDVLHAWAGLGYYARARNLHKCARAVVDEFGGLFPGTVEELKQLPGVGDYTAAAIASIAFDRSETVVDGNVERVIARLFRVETPLPAAKKPIRESAAECTPAHRPGDYAQAMMDLGATICTPKNPKCSICPLSSECEGMLIADSLPTRGPKKSKPTRRGTAFWLERPDGAILFRRREESGLLGGMMEVPSSDWVVDGDVSEATTGPPIEAKNLRRVKGLVRHTFTHFHLELGVLKGQVDEMAASPEACRWVVPDQLDGLALPTVMKKVVELAIKGND